MSGLSSSTNPARLNLPGTLVPAGIALGIIEALKHQHHGKDDMRRVDFIDFNPAYLWIFQVVRTYKEPHYILDSGGHQKGTKGLSAYLLNNNLYFSVAMSTDEDTLTWTVRTSIFTVRYYLETFYHFLVNKGLLVNHIALHASISTNMPFSIHDCVTVNLSPAALTSIESIVLNQLCFFQLVVLLPVSLFA